MASTKENNKSEQKESRCFFFAFIPVLNCIPYFYMNSKIKNRKWNISAWLLLILQTFFIFVLIINPIIDGPALPNYSSVEGFINEEDFMNHEQRIEYEKDYNYARSDEWKSSDEYFEYLKAEDEWKKRENEWMKLPETVEQYNRFHNFINIQTGVQIGISAALGFIWLTVVIQIFLERPRFIENLRHKEIKGRVFDIMEPSVKNGPPIPDELNKSGPAADEADKVDINSAGEEEISALKGLTIIEAKKAVEFRESHGGFKSADEFFSCINAKPHIIVSLENMITVGEYKKSQDKKPQDQEKRIIDI